MGSISHRKSASSRLILTQTLLHNQPNFLLTQAFLHNQPNFLLTQVHLHNQPNFLLTKVILQNQYNFHFNTATPTLIIKVGANWRWFITMSSLKCRHICLSGYLWWLSSWWPTYLPDQTISIEFHPFCNERWYPFLFTGCVLYLSEHHTSNKQSENMQADLFLLRPPTSLYLSLSK